MARKILIVDDEAHIRRLLARALMDFEDEGVEILSAENGETALKLVQEEMPQLMFLDVMMPKMNGFDVCKAVKHDLGLPGIYIAMLTAKGQEMDKERGEQVGADIYLTKPFDPDEILDLARRVLGL
jgi:two-component system, OmpR family, alkaline phosphatase synthesis response regulator PhoP